MSRTGSGHAAFAYANAWAGRARGLTLLELLIVLVIITVLGTVVITNSATLADQARVEQTTRTLDALRAAIIGRPVGPGEDPTSVGAGFIADIGRLPKVVQIDVDGETLLVPEELWSRVADSVTLPAYGLDLDGADGDTTLKMGAGWRGPYVLLPSGGRVLRDGWRRLFWLAQPDGLPVTAADQPIGRFRTSDQLTLLPDSGELELVLRDESLATPIDLTRGAVVVPLGDLSSLPGDEMAVVRLFGPINGEPGVLDQWPTPGGSKPATPPTAIEFEEVPIGPRYLRMYRWTGSTAPTLSVDMGTDAAVAARGIPRRLTVLTGGVELPTPLELP